MKLTEKNHIINDPVGFLNYLESILPVTEEKHIHSMVREYTADITPTGNSTVIINYIEDEFFWLNSSEFKVWIDFFKETDIRKVDKETFKFSYTLGMRSPFSIDHSIPFKSKDYYELKIYYKIL